MYWALTNGSVPPKTQQDYITVGLSVFNLVALAMFIGLLAWHEKTPDAEFGKVVRANISTILAALFLNLVITLYTVLTAFSLL